MTYVPLWMKPCFPRKGEKCTPATFWASALERMPHESLAEAMGMTPRAFAKWLQQEAQMDSLIRLGQILGVDLTLTLEVKD